MKGKNLCKKQVVLVLFLLLIIVSFLAEKFVYADVIMDGGRWRRWRIRNNF